MKPILAFGLLLFLPGVTLAQESKQSAITVFSSDDTIAQVADGENWTTEITLVNLNLEASSYILSFYSDNGQPMQLPFVGLGLRSEIEGSLPVLGSVTYRTDGSSVSLRQGWGQLNKTGSSLGGMAVFRRSLPGIPPFEAVVPFEGYTDRTAVPFDHTGGFLTGLAIANTVTSPLPVTLTFRDESGNVFFTAALTLGAMQHTAFVVSSQYPQTANRRGLIDLTTSGFAMAVLGLRFHPQGAFTTLFPMEGLTF